MGSSIYGTLPAVKSFQPKFPGVAPSTGQKPSVLVSGPNIHVPAAVSQAIGNQLAVLPPFTPIT